ncbi:Signal recognition particle subunit SRP72 [Vermiconidia calcicola]|uniref:Signal recognition particle subunit SRP72 n=1 Tax=Vermiconidia calcicola TaxID=1690605 RepID=A0ACC3MJ32_9PEZI|nr:Signal recognition particle subunit SRP72 [Vermiconidia calcicola]
MSSSVPSLANLLKQTDIEDHEEVLEAADATLKQSKGDLDTQHVRVIALLKLDRYEDAVKALESGGAKLKDRARLEHSYALYKAEAAEIAREGSERGFQHVEAQARYRTEDFRKAAELYQQLASRPEDDAEADLRINTGAVDAQLEWSGLGELVRKKKPGREDLEAFETAYNAACGCIARGELGQGEVLLKRARDLCNALEDLSEEEKQAELLPISVQQVYILARLGRQDEAESLARGLDVRSVPDASTRHIAQVNGVAASATPSNPFLAQRLVTKDLQTLKPDYPFQFQSSILNQNRYATDLQALKFGGTADSIATLISKQTSPNLETFHNSLSVVNAAAHARCQTGKEALKHILPLLEKRPTDVGLILTIVQLYVLTGNHASAIKLLEGFSNRLEQSGSAAELDVRFAPGLVGATVSLYRSQGRRGHEESELAKAATHWRRKTKERPAGAVQLLKAAGGVLVESSEAEHQKLASNLFTELHNQDSDDRYAAAGTIAASPNTASPTQTASLTPIERLVAGIDVEALENAGIAQPTPTSGAAVTTRKRPAEETKPKKAKKIRKSRIPKEYDPNKAPDPERWLPLRDRSTYRPKGKKGKARANLLSQGAAPAGDSDGSRPGTPGGEVVKAKQQQGGGAGKKKKGKGGKW